MEGEEACGHWGSCGNIPHHDCGCGNTMVHIFLNSSYRILKTAKFYLSNEFYCFAKRENSSNHKLKVGALFSM